MLKYNYNLDYRLGVLFVYISNTVYFYVIDGTDFYFYCTHSPQKPCVRIKDLHLNILFSEILDIHCEPSTTLNFGKLEILPKDTRNI